MIASTQTVSMTEQEEVKKEDVKLDDSLQNTDVDTNAQDSLLSTADRLKEIALSRI